MKILTNAVANFEFLSKYNSFEKLNGFCKDYMLDGFEIICAGEIPSCIKNRLTVGFHLPFYNQWIDFYRMDTAILTENFKSRDIWENFYGGKDFSCVEQNLKNQLDTANSLGAEYVVLHVSEVSAKETLTGVFSHSDKEVITNMCSIINRLFKGENYSFKLLLENLWWPGFTFTDPALTEYMLSSIEYPHKGIMLDTGHLLQTAGGICGWEEGEKYINKIIDKNRHLLKYVYGVHLHGGLKKDFVKPQAENSDDFYTQFAKAYSYVQNTDRHLPFETEKIQNIIEKISPNWLVYEFAGNTLEEKIPLIGKQNFYMGRCK